MSRRPNKPAPKPKPPPKPKRKARRMDEARATIAAYADDLWELIRKLKRKLH